VLALFARIPVFRSVLWHIRRKPFLTMAERHRLESEALSRRHARERQDIERLRRAVRLVERRECQALARSRLRTVRATDHKIDMMAINAFDITAMPARRPGDDQSFTPTVSPAQPPAPTPEPEGSAASHSAHTDDDLPAAEHDPSQPLIITADSPLRYLLDEEPEPSEADELVLYEAQLDRLNYLRQWSLTEHFNIDAMYDEMGWEHADPNSNFNHLVNDRKGNQSLQGGVLFVNNGTGLNESKLPMTTDRKEDNPFYMDLPYIYLGSGGGDNDI